MGCVGGSPRPEKDGCMKGQQQQIKAGEEERDRPALRGGCGLWPLFQRRWGCMSLRSNREASGGKHGVRFTQSWVFARGATEKGI